MAGYNRVIMVGNLTRDPEYKQLTSGQAVCRLGLASNRQFKNRQTGDMVQEVCYVDIDVWGAQAESCRQYLQKGRAVLVEGRLKFDTWEDQNGQSRNKLSVVADRVVFLSSAQAEAGMGQGMQPATTNKTQQDAGPQLNPNNPVEKDLMDQLEQMKAKTGAAAATKKVPAQPANANAQAAAPTGEIDFKDSPPFQDDLPF